MLEATDPEYNLLLGQLRLVQRLLNPRSLKFLPPDLQLLQAFLGGWVMIPASMVFSILRMDFSHSFNCYCKEGSMVLS